MCCRQTGLPGMRRLQTQSIWSNIRSWVHQNLRCASGHNNLTLSAWEYFVPICRIKFFVEAHKKAAPADTGTAKIFVILTLSPQIFQILSNQAFVRNGRNSFGTLSPWAHRRPGRWDNSFVCLMNNKPCKHPSSACTAALASDRPQLHASYFPLSFSKIPLE